MGTSSLEKPSRAALKRKAYQLVAECLDALNSIKWKANPKHLTSPNLRRRQHRRKVPKPAKKATPKKAEKTKTTKKTAKKPVAKKAAKKPAAKKSAPKKK